MFNRVLIANRGEIALRVIRACKELGIESVAIYSQADANATHVRVADTAVCVGGPRSVDSYLKIENIISAAELTNADAIHPGYGFLAENSYFNEVCRSSDIEFIGPSPQSMAALGDKNTAREMALAADVPVVPGSDGLLETESEALSVAKKIGYPVLIKATAGGGGKGMRVAENEESLPSAFSQAVTEAESAFGNGGVYIEKLVEQPRHVEVQVIADHHGNVIHLFERDCSTQRRHQKLIEESPSARLPDEARNKICEAAVRMVRQANYHNAATVEFIVDKNDDFYFIEVNARIQVEHPVTEMVTGIDLIQSQIRVASGEELRFSQSDVTASGAAIECRINAEDPEKGFRPSAGKITELFVPGGLGVRFDSHIHADYEVPPYYDSMIGKLIVHRPTREEATKCMIRCLDELHVGGITTTAKFQKQLLMTEEFANATIDTKWVEREFLPQ